jgi:hypothetical protein
MTISPAVTVSLEPIAMNLNDAAKAVGVPVWTLREAVMVGDLRAKKAGRRHVIETAEVRVVLTNPTQKS